MESDYSLSFDECLFDTSSMTYRFISEFFDKPTESLLLSLFNGGINIYIDKVVGPILINASSIKERSVKKIPTSINQAAVEFIKNNLNTINSRKIAHFIKNNDQFSTNVSEFKKQVIGLTDSALSEISSQTGSELKESLEADLEKLKADRANPENKKNKAKISAQINKLINNIPYVDTLLAQIELEFEYYVEKHPKSVGASGGELRKKKKKSHKSKLDELGKKKN